MINKYTLKEVLDFLDRDNILLIDGEDIIHYDTTTKQYKLTIVDKAYLYDKDICGRIIK